MPHFILMTKLGPHALEDSSERKTKGRAWLSKVHRLVPGVHFEGHYAIFGPYDFMDIFEEPDNEAAQRVALISRSDGATSVETWQALTYEHFLALLEQVH